MSLQYGELDASFQAAGREAGIAQLVKDFYQIMDADERYQRLREMHQTDLSTSIDKLAVFLTGWLGGPRLYREKYGPISIPQVHQHLDVDEAVMEQWLSCMQQAIDKQDYAQSFAEYLIIQLRVPAERILAVVQAKRAIS